MDTKPVCYSWKVIVLIHSLKQKKPGEKTHILGRVLQFVFSKVRLSRRQCSDLNAAKIFPGKYLRHYLRPCCKAQRRVSLFQSAARTAFTPPVDPPSPPTAAERPRWRCPFKPSAQYCKTPPLYWRTTNEEALHSEYSLYFAGFEDHVVVSREKWLPAGRRSFFTRGRKRRTEQWRWVKTFKNAPNNVFVGFYTSAEGGRS